MPIVADLTDETQAKNLVQKVHAHYGRVDILINNAGLALAGDIDGADTSDWRRMIDINPFAVLYVTHAIIPVFKAEE